jgi:hypothetical protein
MVTCEFKGRFGNYLFQIAATIGLAAKYNDIAEFEDYINTPEFKNHYTDGVDTSWFPNFNLPKRSHIVENIYEEPGHDFNEIPYMPNLCIKGFWQSEKYFKHVREKLLDIFQIPTEIIPDTIALHYRRGDFYLYPDIFPILSPSYFIASLFEVNRYKDKRVIVFSDEISTCKKIFAKFDFEYSENKNPLQDFYDMCRCENFIISNSAFSWMAAWLSRSYFKTVVCPDEGRWYGSGAINMNTSDLLPDEWIKI